MRATTCWRSTANPWTSREDPWAAFQGLADKPVFLTVNDKPAMAGAREALVQTLASEERLRNLAWIEENRKRVERLSDGQVGYVYVPDTGINGQNELVRMWRAQVTKPGLVIDERFNSGGQIPDRFIELLDRPAAQLLGGARRQGLDDAASDPAWPQSDAHQRLERLGRRLFSVLFQAVRPGAAHWHEDLGRLDWHQRRAAAD